MEVTFTKATRKTSGTEKISLTHRVLLVIRSWFMIDYWSNLFHSKSNRSSLHTKHVSSFSFFGKHSVPTGEHFPREKVLVSLWYPVSRSKSNSFFGKERERKKKEKKHGMTSVRLFGFLLLLLPSLVRSCRSTHVLVIVSLILSRLHPSFIRPFHYQDFSAFFFFAL